jgi:hypothetical protein
MIQGSDEVEMIFTLALLSEAEENEKYTTKRQWIHKRAYGKGKRRRVIPAFKKTGR